MEVAMFLSAPCTLDLYCEASARTHDHFYLITEQAPPPTRRRRLVLDRCEGVS